MKRILFCLFVIIITETNAQQNINWDIRIGGTDTEYANAVDTTADGSMYAAGFIRSRFGAYVMQYFNAVNPLSSDAWLVKYNKFGSIVWSRVFGGLEADEFFDVKATPDGGAISVGKSGSTDGNITNNKGGEDIIAVKYDANGNIEWHENYGTTLIDGARDVIVMPDGTYVLLCYSSGNNKDLTGGKGGRDIWLIQISSTGTIMRKKNFGGSGEDNPFDIKLYNNNNWVITGTTTSNNMDVSGNHGSQDMWVIRLDQDWVLQAQKCFGGTLQDEGDGIVALADGFLITGRSNSTNGDIVGAKGQTDCWVLRTDMSLNIVWKKNYGGTNQDLSNAIELMPDGNALVAGETSSADGDVTSNAGIGDAWLLKINPSNGDLIWNKTYGAAKGDRALDVLVWGDNDFLFTGMWGDPTTSSGSNFSQLWLATSKTLVANGPLPVKLLSFSGKNNGNVNLLQWKTAEEIQTKTFIVQRSTDGAHFTDIGSVAAAGNASTIRTYNFTDAHPVAKAWYQLKMVDIDGRFTYSPVILINTGAKNTEPKLYPSITQSKVNLSFQSATDDEVLIVVSDISGKKMQEERKGVGEGLNTIQTDVSRLTAGNYFLTVYSGDQKFTRRFVKQ